MCRGFHLSHEHVAGHFKWLTKAESLVGVVEERMYSQIGKPFKYICGKTKFSYSGFLELYLLHVDKSLELKETLSEVEKAVDTDYDGSRTYKDVHILVSFVIMCFHDLKKRTQLTALYY